MNKSTKRSQGEADSRAAEIQLIDERITNAKSEAVRHVKKWFHAIWIVLTLLLVLLGIDQATLHNRLGEGIHRALFGPRYEVQKDQTEAAQKLLLALLYVEENRIVEFLEGLPLNTWRDSDDSALASLQNTKAALELGKEQFELSPSDDQKKEDAFGPRLSRHKSYLDAINAYQEALRSKDESSRIVGAWNQVTHLNENLESPREKAVVAILKGLVLQKYVAKQKYSDELKSKVDKLIILATSLLPGPGGQLVPKARNLAGVVQAGLTEVKLAAHGDYEEWVQGTQNTIEIFDEIPQQTRGLLQLKGACLNNSVQLKRLLLWKAGEKGWSINQLEAYHYKYLTEYKTTLQSGQEPNFNSYCEYVVTQYLLPDIEQAIRYWPTNPPFPVTKMEVRMLERAFSKPGEYTAPTNQEGDKTLLADIRQALMTAKDFGYMEFNELKLDDLYIWFNKDNFKFPALESSKQINLFALIDGLSPR